MIQGSLTQTAAFEVYANGQLIFSKLQEGRMPMVSEPVTLVLNVRVVVGTSYIPVPETPASLLQQAHH
jgi:hypothetical protein